MAGIALVVVGFLCLGWGLRAVQVGGRPVDVVGALAAGSGVVLAALGGVALFVPGFLGGP